MQKVWDLLLDEEFISAYRHGFIFTCLDGITRRFYPRILTYSADYPEKYDLSPCAWSVHLTSASRILIATIRDNGLCPCPRCLVPKNDIDRLGYMQDAKNRITMARTYIRHLVVHARDFIYKMGYGLDSAPVKRLLKPRSLVPTLVGQIPLCKFISLSDSASEHLLREARSFWI
jgi:hypothetical protein